MIRDSGHYAITTIDFRRKQRDDAQRRRIGARGETRGFARIEEGIVNDNYTDF